ncbi:MAG TPA: FAD-linked oxidase C-terminal domain-containing protein, partial [Saprospiraceae bacterium]|nr:FAD-linked oxidase C-terminal domain-containing protein [Saprospiraceae bacterium]
PPRLSSTALVSYATLEDGLNAILCLRASSIDIAAIEWMERDAIEVVAQYEGEYGIELEPECACRLWIEIEANDAEALERELYALGDVLSNVPSLNILIADEEATRQRIWKVRRVIGHAVRQYSVYREVDTVVPVSNMVRLIHTIKEIGNRMKFRTLCYGHAGNGNIHVNVLRESMNDRQWAGILTDGVEALLKEVVQLDGVLSAEHGIGLLNRPFMHLQFDAAEIALMRRIKAAFDPNGILNPRKVIP